MVPPHKEVLGRGICVNEEWREASDWIEHPARGQTLASWSLINPERINGIILSAGDAAANLWKSITDTRGRDLKDWYFWTGHSRLSRKLFLLTYFDKSLQRLKLCAFRRVGQD